MEGRRDLGIGEESHDEVRPSEITNALPGIRIFSRWIGTGRGCVAVCVDEDAWGIVSLLIGGAGVWLVGLVVGDGGGDREKR
jgi:hypothetical protein